MKRRRTRYGPLALLHHRLDSLDNAWVRLADILRLREKNEVDTMLDGVKNMRHLR